LAQAEPDGYTIGFINTPPVISIPIEREAQFSLDDFDLIANVVDDPTAISVRAASPFQTFEELVEEARQNPGAAGRLVSLDPGDHLRQATLCRGCGARGECTMSLTFAEALSYLDSFINYEREPRVSYTRESFDLKEFVRFLVEDGWLAHWLDFAGDGERCDATSCTSC
jgi:hypothetical protein